MDWTENAVSSVTGDHTSFGGSFILDSISATYWRGRIWMVFIERNGNGIKVASMDRNDVYADTEIVIRENTISPNNGNLGVALDSNIIPSIAGTEGSNGSLHIVFGALQANGGTKFYHVQRDPRHRVGTEGGWGEPQSIMGHYGSTHPSLHANGSSLYLASIYQSGGTGSYADNLYIYHFDSRRNRWVKAYRAMSKGKPIQTDPSSPAALIMGSGPDITVVLKEKKSRRMRRYGTSLRYLNLGVWRDVGPIGYNASTFDGRPSGTQINGDYHVMTGFGKGVPGLAHAVLEGSRAAVRSVPLREGRRDIRAENPSIVSYMENGQPVVRMFYTVLKNGITSVLSASHSGNIVFPK